MPFEFRNLKFGVLLLLGMSVVASSPLALSAPELKVLTIKWEDKFAVGRGLYEKDAKPPEKGIASELFAIKSLEKQNKFLSCYKEAKRLDTKTSIVRRWLSVQKLQCAISNVKVSKGALQPIQEAFFSVLDDRSSMTMGPHLNRLREAWVEGGMILLDGQMRSRSPNVWTTFDALEEFSSWIPRGRRAEMYRIAGEVSFYQQKLATSVGFFERSLKEEDREATRLRYQVVKSEFFRSQKKPVPVFATVTPDRALEATPEELEIEKRFQESMRKGDLVAAVEDGVKLLKEYPGGMRAQVASKQILNIYLSLAQKKDEKLISLRNRVVDQMRLADGQRMYEWARTMALREYYEDAIKLSQQSLELVGGQPVATEILLLLGQSALHTNNLKEAKGFFDRLIREHAGTKAAMEATFRRGLIHYREGAFAEASILFEKYLTLKVDTDFEISSLYWLWRSQQQLKNPKSDEVAKDLIRRFPLSYYGLRARSETSGNKLSFDKLKNVSKFKVELSMAPHEYEGWERFVLLLKSGWLMEAQMELEYIPAPVEPEGKIIWARLWASAYGYHKAFDLLQSVWQEDPAMISEDILRIAYPKEFISLIEVEAKRTKINPLLVLSLVRQESTFRPEALSPATAMGLMQVVPNTAREVAGDMRLKSYQSPVDLFTPDVNIKIGSTYLQRLLRASEGNVPLALAMYNAGIGNVRNWLIHRDDLKDLKTNATSKIEAEIWFDELPWLETSGYIKSILRNYIIYKYLDQPDQPLNEPIWRI